MEGPPLGPGGEDITWPDQVAPRGRKASSTRKIKPQTSNHRGNTTGQDSHQRAATHHNHAKRRASPDTGARPRTGCRTRPEHRHHTPTVP